MKVIKIDHNEMSNTLIETGCYENNLALQVLLAVRRLIYSMHANDQLRTCIVHRPLLRVYCLRLNCLYSDIERECRPLVSMQFLVIEDKMPLVKRDTPMTHRGLKKREVFVLKVSTQKPATAVMFDRKCVLLLNQHLLEFLVVFLLLVIPDTCCLIY